MNTNGALLAGIAILLALLLSKSSDAQSGDAPDLRVRSLELVDRNGEVVGRLYSPERKLGAIELDSGRARVLMMVDADERAKLVLESPQDRVEVVCDEPGGCRVLMFNKRSALTTKLAMDQHGIATLELGQGKEPRGSRISLHGQKGKIDLEVLTHWERLIFRDEQNNRRLEAMVRKGGDTTLEMWGRELGHMEIDARPPPVKLVAHAPGYGEVAVVEKPDR